MTFFHKTLLSFFKLRNVRLLILFVGNILALSFLPYSQKLIKSYRPIPHVLKHPREQFTQKLVAHALGHIGSTAYSNSFEGFVNSYKKGFRTFEIDLEFIKSGELICFHIGHESEVGLNTPITQYSLSEIKERKFGGLYEIQTAEEFLKNTAGITDFYIITDTKGDFTAVNSELLRLAKLHSPSLLRRIIPQVYGDGISDLQSAEKIYDYEYIFFSLYKTENISTKYITNFLHSNKISGIVIDKSRLAEIDVREIQMLAPIFVHSVTTPEEESILTGIGVYGLYINM